jgi:L-amino acid N-acyltransferase YncA
LIYTASAKDIPGIIEMALNIPREHGFENLPPVDIVKTTEFFYEKWAEAPIFVYKENEKIKGFVATQLIQVWWSDKTAISDFVFYVDPESRQGTKIFEALSGALKDFSKLNKLPVILSFMSNSRTEAKERLFRKFGFKKCGFLLSYGI